MKFNLELIINTTIIMNSLFIDSTNNKHFLVYIAFGQHEQANLAEYKNIIFIRIAVNNRAYVYKNMK